jgi:DNA-binding CsgD family transcriptional regulator
MASPTLDVDAASGLLVGRADELRAVAQALADGGGPGGLVLCGDEGVGKTRLAREALGIAGGLGRTTHWVAATRAAAAIPFGAVAHLLPATAPDDLCRLLRSTAQALTSEADGRRAVVAVDDAHLLDDASAALVHHLAVSGAAFVVVTVRTGSDVPSAVTALWKDGLAARVDVPPLTMAETTALVESELGSPADGVTHRRLWRLSRGNALHLRELLRAALDSGTLTRREDVWGWHGSVVAAPRLVELMASRLSGQPRVVRDLLDLVALGGPLRMTLLEGAGVDPDVIEAAERTGLLSTSLAGGDIDVRITYPLLGAVAVARASALHRCRTSRRLAAAADAARTGVDEPRTLVWRLDGGVAVDPVVLGSAARRALAVLDLPLARRLAQAAVDGGGGPGAEALLVPLQVQCGAATEAEEGFVRLAGHDLPEEVAAELAAVRAWNLAMGLHRLDDATAVLDSMSAAGDVGRGMATAVRAQFLNMAGRPAEAVATASTVTTQPGVRDQVAVRGLLTTCQALAVQGRHIEAVAAGEHALAVARRLDGDFGQITAEGIRAALAVAHLGAGRLARAQALVDGGRELATEAGWHIGAAVWAGRTGELALARGLPHTALGHFREALALSEQSTDPQREWVSGMVALDHVQAAALLGLEVEAAAAGRRAACLARPWTGVLQARAGGADSWVAIAHGQVSSAVDRALEAADHASVHGQYGWELDACHLVVRLGAANRVCDRMTALGDRVDGRLACLTVRHAVASTRRDGDELERISRDLEELGHVLLAAEATAQAAVAYRLCGRLADTAGAGARARQLAARCEGARTPALASLTEPSGLTRRENEIAQLAARGLTNRSIADTLVISVRTVDNTLHQAYAKLGVSGRAGLKPLFPSAEPRVFAGPH